jgi:hypothetical protein
VRRIWLKRELGAADEVEAGEKVVRRPMAQRFGASLVVTGRGPVRVTENGER